MTEQGASLLLKRSRYTGTAALAVLSIVVGIPAAASGASTTNLWVSNSASVSGVGNSCIHPGYSNVQSALNAVSAGGTVHVCPGTYTEQLVIAKAVKLLAVDTAGSVKVVLPASPADSTTICDTAAESKPSQPDQDAVSICTPGSVTVTGLTIEARWPGSTCDDSLYGILVAGGATLKATNVTVDGAGASPINGCQGGVAIQVGMAWKTPVEVGHATLAHDDVTGYQKNGITVDGVGSSAKISTTTVTGAGATKEIAQNGIQISNGALATIASSSISGNECDDEPACGPNGFTSAQATGALFFGAAKGSSITGTSLNENDDGIYYVSESPTQPTTPELRISNDVFSGDRYESIVLDQGNASVTGNKITAPSNVGIELFQYKQQAYAPDSTATNDEIEGMGEAAIKVESDNESEDKPGKFTVRTSNISHNPAIVINNSKTFTVATNLGDF